MYNFFVVLRSDVLFIIERKCFGSNWTNSQQRIGNRIILLKFDLFAVGTILYLANSKPTTIHYA